jgi:hypothetical protein
MTYETCAKIEGQRIENKTDLVRQENDARPSQTINPEQLIQAIPTAVRDAQMITLLDMLTVAEQSLVIKKNDFGPKALKFLSSTARSRICIKKSKLAQMGLSLR